MGDVAIKVDIDIDDVALANRLGGIIDEKSMLSIHQLLRKMCDPYVPYGETGILSTNVDVTSEFVRYPGPYAHYQYTGDVYGPNIPIMENGVIVGWFSIPGQKKHPTGEKLTYSTNVHSQATDHWDKAMMREHGDEFRQQVKDILVNRAREKYG